MFRKIILIAANVLFFTSCYSQNYNWITPNKTYLKMYIADDGMYRINKADFLNAGIAETIDPRTIKLYNLGVQIPVYFSGQNDGVFDPSDYFDFYGSRNYGGPTKTYDHNNNLVYTTNEYYNSYSDTNVYWIEWGGSFGLRMSESAYSAPSNYLNQYFSDIVHLEKDKFYSQGETVDPFSDFRFLSTEKFRGEGWYWSVIGNNQTLSDTFSIPNLYNVPQTATVRIFAYPTNRTTSILNEHSLQIKVNNVLVGTLYANDLNRMDSTLSFSSSLLSSVSVNTVSATYVPASGFSGSVNFDLFEINYPRTFKLNPNKLSAKLGGVDTTSRVFRIANYSNASPINIYDVLNNTRINFSTVNLDTLIFTGKSNARFEVVNGDIVKKPLRIKQRIVPDLANPSNGADYLLIYHNSLMSQAEQLRAYRSSHDGFRSFKAEIEDIYDIFNYGVENPIAVRNFTSYVYNNWQLPKVSFICLFGRASLDPKKNLSTSVYYQNMVPTYGNPPSDGYFANFKIGTFCYYTQIAMGRIPAASPPEAQSIVDKIISYESNPPQRWWKNFAFITGGGTPSEQASHQSTSEFEIGFYVNVPPIVGDPHRIYRTDTTGTVTYNIRDSLRNDINRGVSFINFRGHAGSHDWEVAMADPNTLSNETRLPLILSLTCFTGENSKPDYRGFGEQFLYLADKGAIGFVGTTGWSYTSSGNSLGTNFLQTMKTDSTRRIGSMMRYSETKMSSDSLQFQARHTINSYVLLGDPATKINFPKHPEFSISNSDYKISNTPSLGEFASVTIYPKNFGTNTDSVKIRMQIKKNGQNYFSIDTVRRNFKMSDTLNYNIKVDSIGLYSAVVTLDCDNWYPSEIKTNNSIAFDIGMINTTFVPLKPVNNSLVTSDSIEFCGLNPVLKFSENSVKNILQMDTTTSFNSALLKTFVNSSPTGAVTKFKTSIPVMTNNKFYYWRTNSIINGDSTGWSAVQTFIYSIGSIKSSSERSSIKETNGILEGNPVTSVYKFKSSQFAASDLNNVTYDNGGFELTEYPATLFVRSYGSNGEEASYFSVGSKNVFVDGGGNTGLNLLKVKKVNGAILKFKNFKMNTGASSDSLVTFLNTFDSTHYLMLLNAAWVNGGTVLNTSAKTKLRQFGSIYCDSISLLGYFHTWSMIGWLGASHAQIQETYDPCCRTSPNCTACDHWTEATCSMSVNFKNTAGTISNVVGPAKTWTDFSWMRTLNPNSSVMFDVYGISPGGAQTLLMQDVQTNKSTDISHVDTRLYPKLNLVAKINIDTAAGNMSSSLNSIKVDYTPAAELVSDLNSFKASSSYKAGQELKYEFNCFNAGYSPLQGTILNVYQKNPAPQNLIKTDTLIFNLSPDSMKFYYGKAVLPYFRDSLRLCFETKPVYGDPQFSFYNDIIYYTLTSYHIRSSRESSLQVLTDGSILNSGDYVNPKPEIKITLTGDANSLPLLSDTSQLSIRLNDKVVPYFERGKLNAMLRTVDKDNGNAVKELLFYPKLDNGISKLSIAYKIDSDNSDTVSYDIQVSDELAIKDMYNYPNPMKNDTKFIFTLTGMNAPNNFAVKIYTITGRLIKVIRSTVKLGSNSIPWDCRDDDGDIVANGTYLYKLTAEGDSKLESQVQKLVVLR